jgi:hypothetical protein
MTVKFYDALDVIYDRSHKITIKSCLFPKSLRKIIHVNDFWGDNIIYERQVGYLTKMAIINK